MQDTQFKCTDVGLIGIGRLAYEIYRRTSSVGAIRKRMVGIA